MSDPTLLFGIGAAKAGTSWLQSALDAHPEVHLWRHKELHYFDALDRGEVMQQIDHLCAKRTELRGWMATATGRDYDDLHHAVSEIDRWLGVLARGQESEQAYLSFLKKGRKGAKVVGDITPAYALLSEDRLRRMHRLMPVVKFVYLLRDPVDRLWSNIRMKASWEGGSEAELQKRATKYFDRWTKDKEPEVQERGDYAGALARLFAAVPERDRLVAFYEEFFTQDAWERLCGFLGISVTDVALDQRVHESAQAGLDADRRAKARARLADQYDAVERMLGRVPASWSAASVEV